MLIPIRLAVLFAASHALLPAAHAQQAEFIPLGDLPGGDNVSEALALSADGTVVVGSTSSTASGPFPSREAYRWSAAGGMVGLGDLPGGPFSSRARGVSADGSVVVGSAQGAAPEAFRWTQAGGMVGLGDLPGGSVLSIADDVSEDGSVVVGHSFSAGGVEAFRWTAGSGMVGLGAFPGGSGHSFANATNADGSVVVGSSTPQVGLKEAFRWTAATGMVGLGDLPGGSISSDAFAVSADGSVVVGQSQTAEGREAFRWTQAGGMVGLGDLPQPGVDGVALACSADGSVVVGESAFNHHTHAFVWTEQTGMLDLRDELFLIGVGGVNGWDLYSAHGISADGTLIAGTGINPAGEEEAWLVRLPRRLGRTYCSPASGNSSNTNASIVAYGSAAAQDLDLTLYATGLPLNQIGVFLASRNQGAFVPPGSSGLFCLSGDFGRFNLPGQVIQGPHGFLVVDLTSIPVNPSAAVVAGDTWNFQCWFRDLPTWGNNLTDAVSIVFH